MPESRSEVDIGDLQRSLRECIERVRAGEQVIVADGGRPVARLSPIDESADRVGNGDAVSRLWPDSEDRTRAADDAVLGAACVTG